MTRAILDDFDRAILRLYQLDTHMPAHEIGESVHLSSAAVQRRLKRMREAGVIRAEIAHLDASAAGLPVTVIVHVDLERETLAHIDAFKAMIRSHPQVQQCWYTAGAIDFVLVVHVPTLADYEQFTRSALMGDGCNVASFTSFVVLGEVIGGLALAL